MKIDDQMLPLRLLKAREQEQNSRQTDPITIQTLLFNFETSKIRKLDNEDPRTSVARVEHFF